MKFKVKESRNFVESGKVFTAPVVARKLNGLKVRNPNGNVVFLPYEDIEIISISDEERNMNVEW